ncbi:MAG TPA: 16S rRNA (cytosine(967)-C(5))-methyltransferase RsmB [Burkholderiales bacterium]|nr:16S rRNA (cytosine(967)-C(5))-methyltransferase RsmB [Burkholderiales bacterium]
MNARASLAQQLAQAARIVARVAGGASLAEEFNKLSEDIRPWRGALIDLTHGTLRRYGRVQGIVAALSRKGRPEPLVEALLWCALYALESGRYGDHTVVDQGVKACALIERWPVKGFVNAVLRGFLRERASIENRLGADPEAVHQHPGWWIDALRTAYPQAWPSILAAGNAHPPMALRINARRTSVEVYSAKLAGQGIHARRAGPSGLVLDQPLPVERVPGFEAGEVSVQDLGAQRAAHCLDLQPGQRVLDACAAPGGKSAHIVELAEVSLTALDVDGARAARIAPNLERLGLSATIMTGDASRPESWWDGKPFDRILADVPCSASGIVRRHPDVKWLRRSTDLVAFGERQRALVAALWRLLAPNGKLLYATCSVFPQENDDVVAALAGAQSGARRISLPDGGPEQSLPDAEHDGFFYALIEKQA